MKKPLGVSLISYFYIFGAGVLMVSAIFYNADANEIGIADRFGVPNYPEQMVRIIVAIITLIIIYGYISLKKWGFWLMIAYSASFGCISYSLLLSQNQQPFIGNFIWSMMVLVYTLYVKKVFFLT